MQTLPDAFDIRYKNTFLYIKKVSVDKQTLYAVHFSSPRKPIVLTQAVNANGETFWTSVPQGRQDEAIGIGKLIDEYYQHVKP